MTLFELSLDHTSTQVVERLLGRPPRLYETRLAKRSDGTRVCLWAGDAGYDAGDPDADGDTSTKSAQVVASLFFDFIPCQVVFTLYVEISEKGRFRNSVAEDAEAEWAGAAEDDEATPASTM